MKKALHVFIALIAVAVRWRRLGGGNLKEITRASSRPNPPGHERLLSRSADMEKGPGNPVKPHA
jgi:hypothetical protein